MVQEAEEREREKVDCKGAMKKLDEIDSSSDSESDEERESEGVKRTIEQLDQDEVEALKNDLGQDHREGKRVKRANNAGAAKEASGPAEKEEPSTKSEEVWDSLKAQSADVKDAEETKAEETILVKRTYRFAGEVVHEEKLLPVSHPDAVAYVSGQKGAGPASTSIASVRPQGAPGPRKKKSSLAAMSAAATGKTTKINTLEKSKMDWNKFKEHNAEEGEKDEMEAQTKGGGSGLGSMKGYMERKSFLDRVQGRVEDQRKG